MKVDEGIVQNRSEFWSHVRRDYDIGVDGGTPSGTPSRTVVIGGILTIAIADAMSDALGMHIAEESKNNGVVSEI